MVFVFISIWRNFLIPNKYRLKFHNFYIIKFEAQTDKGLKLQNYWHLVKLGKSDIKKKEKI